MHRATRYLQTLSTVIRLSPQISRHEHKESMINSKLMGGLQQNVTRRSLMLSRLKLAEPLPSMRSTVEFEANFTRIDRMIVLRILLMLIKKLSAGSYKHRL